MNRKPIDIIILVLAIGMGLYHLTRAYWICQGEIEHRITHLMLALSMVFLIALKTSSSRRWLLGLLIVAALLSTGYIRVFFDDLMWRKSVPTTPDIIIGLILIFTVFEACRRQFGIALPIVGIIMLFYGLFGHYFPGIWGHVELSLSRLITTIVLGFGLGGFDMFGMLLDTSANMIAVLMLLTGLLQAFKATDFFTEVGRLLGRHVRSGAGQTAVVSSALFGTISGQVTPNILVDGVYTIALMKKVGFKPAVAASIEAAASSGGQIMPPVMGVAAFVMADILGVPYAKIIVMAIIPALLYYFALGAFVHFQAVKTGIAPYKEEVSTRRLLAAAPLFIVPLGIILILVFRGYTLLFSTFWSIVALFAVAFIRKETRPSISSIMDGFVTGALSGSQVAIACATLSPLISLAISTGLGLKIAHSVEAWSYGHLFLGLVLMVAVQFIIGMEMPTVAAYVIGAVVCVPALLKLGVPLFPAHFFTFYYATLSALTPPVGIGALVASRLAGAGYFETGFHAVNAAIGAYVLPFVFVFNPSLLLVEGTNPFWLLVTIMVVAAGLIIFQAGTVGYLLLRLNPAERILAVVGGLLLLVFAAVKFYPSLLLAICLLVPMVLWQMRRSMLSREVQVETKSQ